MPNIFEYFGLIFYFYSNEHTPIHVHVKKGGKEIVFEIIMKNDQLHEVKKRNVKGKEPLTSKEIAEAEKFVITYHKNIIKKWVNYFVLGKAVNFTKIKTKL